MESQRRLTPTVPFCISHAAYCLVGLALLIPFWCACNAQFESTSRSTGDNAQTPGGAAGAAKVPADASQGTDYSTRPIRVLLLGNSHSHFGGLAEMLRSMLEVTEGADAVALENRTAMFLDSFASHETLKQSISDGDWTHVILQGQKVSMSGKYDYSIDEAVELAKLAESSGARGILFAEWGRRGVAGETERFAAVYARIADQSGATIAPVGAAWEHALDADPELDLFAADGNHANQRGAFLAACILHAMITGKDPASIALDQAKLIDRPEYITLQARADQAWQQLAPTSSAGNEAATRESAEVQAVPAAFRTRRPTNRPPQWFRGNLHTHSLWSDGDDFPEMITAWYADHGYHFLAMTDHNVLAVGDHWMDRSKIVDRGGEVAIEKYIARFGDPWVRTRTTEEGVEQIRLTPLDEYRGRFEKPGEFLLLQGEEVSDSVNRLPVHLNAINLEKLLRPTGGASVREAIDSNIRALQEQASAGNRRMIMQVNHPNFGWAATAEDLAAVARARFFEVYNAHPGVNHLGDETHVSIERMWDIANTLRIDKLTYPPLLGLATDDSHYYHGRPGSHPGRGWIMVRAESLTSEDLMASIQAGEFYCSSGVALSEIDFDPETGLLALTIEAEDGVEYTTQFIGTRRGYDDAHEPRRDEDGSPLAVTQKYSEEIGAVLATETGTSPRYQFAGDEIYVRAVITSDQPHPDPSFKDQVEQAWTQPVVWEPGQ